jgi:DNA-binding response OmpR family regulator
VILLRRAIKKAGLDCPLHVASDGQMAIDCINGAGKFRDRDAFPFPSLVVLDLKLPQVPGLEVLKWIRNEAGLHVPVVILSSSQHERDISTAYKHGANAYLVKRSDLTEVLDMAKMIAGFWLRLNNPPPSPAKDEQGDDCKYM